MSFQIIPKEKIVISTTKSYEEINAILADTFGQQKDKLVRFFSSANNFTIQKDIPYNNLSKIIAKGTIIMGSDRNYIRIEITALDRYLRLATFGWYALNSILFLFLLYLSIENGLSFLVLLPIVLVAAGYGLTTGSLQRSMNKIVEQIRVAVK